MECSSCDTDVLLHSLYANKILKKVGFIDFSLQMHVQNS